jgi:soluble lytic murein transglycosylase-like protein
MKTLLKGLFFCIIFLSYKSTEVIENKQLNVQPGNEIYKQIIRSNPRIDKQYAARLSQKIHKAAKKYEINARIYTAILAQESMFRSGAINPKSKDYGIAQVHHKTAKAYGFDIDRLTNDTKYSIKAGAKILGDIKKRYSHKEDTYWSRYNSSNPERRERYEELVRRYM